MSQSSVVGDPAAARPTLAALPDPYPSRVAPAPTRASRTDPVAYEEWRRGCPLEEGELRRYEADGFLVLHDLFAPAEVRALQDELARLRESSSSLDPETLIREPDSEALRSIFEVHRQSPRFARLARDARLAGLAEFLLADRVYVHQSRLNYKPGFSGREFPWHSDFETWHVEDGMPRMRAVSISMLLSANGEQNGPLLLIPGSHRTFVGCVGETPEDHYKASLRRQDYGVPDRESLTELVAAGGLVSVTGPPGTVVVFDCNALHGSNGNITPLPRSNAFIVYNAWCNRLVAPFGGTRPRPEFIAARSTRAPLSAVEGPLAP